MKNLFLSLTLLITCLSCTTEDIPELKEKESLITISNDDKPFEYWLDSVHYSTNGPISIYVPQRTQITITAVVRVVDGAVIIPNVKLYQDNKLVELRQVTSGFFWYQIP
jgi:hypothetical protein